MPPKTARSRSRPRSQSKKRTVSRSRSRARNGHSNGTKTKEMIANGNHVVELTPVKNDHNGTLKPNARHVPTAEELYNVQVPRQFTPHRDRWNGRYEFMGLPGVLTIMIMSHFLIYYFYICVEKYHGTLIYPGHAELKGDRFDLVMWHHLKELCSPTLKTFAIFISFLFIEYILAVILPGVQVKGLPLPSENGYRLTYKCNAIWAWYCMLIIAAALQYTNIFPIRLLREEFGHYLTAATITADVLAIWVYLTGLKRAIRTTDSYIYNFFMGSALNYRLPGNVDVKLFAECRNSWVLLMMLTLSCAAEQYHVYGHITRNMAFMILAHLLYVNAIQKGEECIVTTWDIYYEKFGWMLAFWNTCGVPFLYCMQSLYIQTVLGEKEHPTWVIAIMVVALLICYYLWDTVNSQKNRFRMHRNGVPMSIIKRRTFPQLPWRYIDNPHTVKSSRGELFVDGFYRYARKIHYTVDICMAFLWGCACGFASFIPFFYVVFFTSHLVDRERRDEHRCRAKYGKLWDEYVNEVPYKFIPYIY